MKNYKCASKCISAPHSDAHMHTYNLKATQQILNKNRLYIRKNSRITLSFMGHCTVHAHAPYAHAHINEMFNLQCARATYVLK